MNTEFATFLLNTRMVLANPNLPYDGDDYNPTGVVDSQYGTKEVANLTHTFKNVNLKAILGKSWDKYSTFKLELKQLIQILQTGELPQTPNLSVYISGLSWLNSSYSVGRGTNNQTALLCNLSWNDSPISIPSGFDNPLLFKKTESVVDITLSVVPEYMGLYRTPTLWGATQAHTYPSTYTAQVLVVAGGGCGSGHSYGGGGGAGGLLADTFACALGQAYTIQVGVGGGVHADLYGLPGGSSIFTDGTTDIVTVGGGGGSSGTPASASEGAGDGGSGGGGGAIDYSAGGSGVSGQGFDGGNGTGNGVSTHYRSGGGGGGAGGAGQDAPLTGFGGNGGDAAQWAIDSYYYAGGGGAGTRGGGQPSNERGGRGGGFSTTLVGDIDSSETELEVDSSVGMKIGYTLLIGTERMHIVSIAGDILTVTRGVLSSSAAAHSDTDNVLVELGGAGAPVNTGGSGEQGMDGQPNTGSGSGCSGNGTVSKAANGVVKIWVPYVYEYDADHITGHDFAVEVEAHEYSSVSGSIVTFTNTSTNTNAQATWYIPTGNGTGFDMATKFKVSPVA